MSDLEGVMLSEYVLLQCINKGGVADVYRARRSSGDTFEVAVKVFRPGYAQRASFREYFMAEAEKVGQFDHPNILPFLEYGEGEELLYLVTPFVTTGTLADLLERVGGRFPAMQAVSIVQQLCSAVQYAHDHEVIHGNIKPTNIFVAGDGRMLLADFGIARRYDDSQQSVTRVGWGSAEYAAPEQSLGILRRSSDIYSLGILFFKLLTGTTPFTGQTPVEVLLKHVRQAPPSVRDFVPSVSDAVDSVLRTAMQKRSDDRFPSAEALSNAFQAAVAVAPVASPVARSTGWLDARALRGASLPSGNTQQVPVSQRHTPPVGDPVTPVPPSIIFSLPSPIPPEIPDTPDRAWGSSDTTYAHLGTDVTQVRKKNFLQEDDGKEPSFFWSADPAEWSPIAKSDPASSQLSVPVSASEYLKSKPLLPAEPALETTYTHRKEPTGALETVERPEPVVLPEPEMRNRFAARLHHLLPIIVVALLLIGLLMALLSTFFFPTR